jgi:hypothetical protein
LKIAQFDNEVERLEVAGQTAGAIHRYAGGQTSCHRYHIAVAKGLQIQIQRVSETDLALPVKRIQREQPGGIDGHPQANLTGGQIGGFKFHRNV